MESSVRFIRNFMALWCLGTFGVRPQRAKIDNLESRELDPFYEQLIMAVASCPSLSNNLKLLDRKIKIQS